MLFDGLLQAADCGTLGRVPGLEIEDVVTLGERARALREFVDDAAAFGDLGWRQHVRDDEIAVGPIEVDLVLGEQHGTSSAGGGTDVWRRRRIVPPTPHTSWNSACISFVAVPAGSGLFVSSSSC